MSFRCVSLASLALLTSAALFTPLAAHAAAPAMLINQPGNYTLSQDIMVAGGDAVMITASGVTLDMGGHNVYITTPGQGRGIVVQGARGVHITNGKVHFFAVNVWLQNSENVTLDGVQIVGANLPLNGAKGNAADPLASGGPGFSEVGVLLLDTRGAVVRNNTITSVSAGIFNRGGSATGSLFEGNTITGGPTAANNFLAICFNPIPSEGAAGPSACVIQGNHAANYTYGFAYQGVEYGNISRNNTILTTANAYFYPDANAANNMKNTTIVNDTVVALAAP